MKKPDKLEYLSLANLRICQTFVSKVIAYLSVVPVRCTLLEYAPGSRLERFDKDKRSSLFVAVMKKKSFRALTTDDEGKAKNFFSPILILSYFDEANPVNSFTLGDRGKLDRFLTPRHLA
jgi:hypothetical protein